MYTINLLHTNTYNNDRIISWFLFYNNCLSVAHGFCLLWESKTKTWCSHKSCLET